MSSRRGLGEGSAAASKASSVSMRSKVMRRHTEMADCADKEVFLGFLAGSWLARTVSCGTSPIQAKKPCQAEKCGSATFFLCSHHIFTLARPFGTAPDTGVAQGVTQIFSVVQTPKLYSKHIVWHSPAQP